MQSKLKLYNWIYTICRLSNHYWSISCYLFLIFSSFKQNISNAFTSIFSARNQNKNWDIWVWYRYHIYCLKEIIVSLSQAPHFLFFFFFFHCFLRNQTKAKSSAYVQVFWNRKEKKRKWGFLQKYRIVVDFAMNPSFSYFFLSFSRETNTTGF